MPETSTSRERVETEAALYRQLTHTRTRLQKSLQQIRVIRRNMDAMSQRYEQSKARGNVRYCYSLKLRISVFVGVWEMYRDYAKLYATLLTSARQAHNIYSFFANLQERYTGDRIERALDTDGYNFTDDEMEEFIVDVTEDASSDDSGELSDGASSGLGESDDEDVEGEVAVYFSAVTVDDDNDDDVIGPP